MLLKNKENLFKNNDSMYTALQYCKYTLKDVKNPM